MFIWHIKFSGSKGNLDFASKSIYVLADDLTEAIEKMDAAGYTNCYVYLAERTHEIEGG